MTTVVPSADDAAFDELAALLLAMPAPQLERWLLDQPPDAVELVERVLGEQLTLGWRATPDAFAHRLDPTYKRWPYVRLLGEKFRQAIAREDPKQLWNMPSQYGKTTGLMWGVLWALDHDPTLRIMYVSYDADRAVDEGGKARDLAERHADQLRFRLRSDRRARGKWMTEEGGGLYCVGVYGGITGFPQDVILLDDLIKGWQVAHSEAQRQAVWNIYRSQVRMRVQDENAPIIAAGTRWHEDDPTGRLLQANELGGDRFTLVRLAAIAETHDPASHDALLREPDPLGRAPGEVLEPERFNEREVRARHISLGSYLTAAMEQQRPAPEEGGEIKRAWWRLETRLPTRWDDGLTSWDMKLKDKESGDYVVGQVWVRVGADYWMLDQLRGQWNQATAANAIALMQVRHPRVNRHVVENTGYGPEVMDALRHPLPRYEVSDEVASALGMTADERIKVQDLRRRGLPGLIPENPKGDKRVRARAQSPYVEAGNAHLPENASWLGAFLDETAAFPNGSHDDQVDAWSQAFKRLTVGPASATAATGSVGPSSPTRQAPALGPRGSQVVRPQLPRLGGPQRGR